MPDHARPIPVGLSTASVYPEGAAAAFETAARLGYEIVHHRLELYGRRIKDGGKGGAHGAGIGRHAPKCQRLCAPAPL